MIIGHYRRLRQEDCKFGASLSYIAKLSQKDFLKTMITRCFE